MNGHVPYGIYEKCIKRALDILCSSLALILLSPIFLILIVLIKINMKGNVFFTQERTGRNEVPFKMIKFRTMTNECDDEGNLLPDTERFTKLGNVLRALSLDELPEFLNVFKGDMSLIGPRPLYTFYVPFYTDRESLRHAVRGGITGLAQVNGRALCRWNDRFNYDVQYVSKITFVNDIKILWLTVRNVIKKSDIGIPSVTDEGGLHLVRELQRPDKAKEIGSSFSIRKKEIAKTDMLPDFVDKIGYSNKYFFSVARSCIEEVIILKGIKVDNKVALVPPFTCESVLEPFEKEGFRVIPYIINRDFSLNVYATKELISKNHPSVFIFHDYFGFDTTKGLKELLETYDNIVVINDSTQSMFSDINDNWADYCLGSIRKWGSLPDGAFLLSRSDEFSMPEHEDKTLVDLEIDAMDLKQNYLETHKGDKQEFLSKFADIRSYIDKNEQCYCMSKTSCFVLNKMHKEDFCRIRRNNFSVLYDELEKIDWIECPLGPLSDEVVPFMFPIFISENRSDFQKFLARNNVFATVIWSCPDAIKDLVNETSKNIYSEILCIPCDQRYTVEDMHYISNTIKKYKTLNQ